MALGGTLLEHVNGMINDDSNDDRSEKLRSAGINDPMEAHDSSHPLEVVMPYTILENLCIRLGHHLDNHSRCGIAADYVSTHRATVLGSIGLLATLFLVVWPLTWDCRRRAHRRRMRKIQQQFGRENDSMTGTHDETSQLIIHSGVENVTTYGTTGTTAY